ncbi:hypothetical protein [Pyxidicoccus xibeiensis]|uniref:hypothetical protein n=1 Tax=Pyxidicoccus xibeiensis TaxID=2906759 RepID=UPI0020A82BD2|nr:hypothetical protein [Pyxidicoccus xibeiensis]MCP3137355.1 hypothetical protein [Pyxidicoccus xibeiensis]
MRIDLDTAFLDDGIRSTNFFNGRLLSAEDLTQEQQARKEALKQFGVAFGEGVVHGLEVEAITGGSSATEPIVTVKKGLALNREGRALELKQPVEVSLLRGASNDTTAAGAKAGFGACSPPGSVYVSGTGVYLLVISEADGREGRAETSGLGGVTSSGCEAKRLVDGVRFRLLRLDVPVDDLQNTPAKRQKLRNRVAHHCFGTTDTQAVPFRDYPFAVPTAGYGAIDKLRPQFLTDCDVPLAVIHWRDTEGIRFVDMWSARRRPTRSAQPPRWALGVGDRRASEGEAMFLQFQEQLDTLRATNPQTLKAKDHFHFLPPAGVVPLGHAAFPGFDTANFFEGVTVRHVVTHVEGARMQALLRLSFAFPPVSFLTGTAGGTDPFVWVYKVRENQQALSASGPTQEYLVFASGHMPDVSEPRFDASHWSFGNYALR